MCEFLEIDKGYALGCCPGLGAVALSGRAFSPTNSSPKLSPYYFKTKNFFSKIFETNHTHIAHCAAHNVSPCVVFHKKEHGDVAFLAIVQHTL